MTDLRIKDTKFNESESPIDAQAIYERTLSIAKTKEECWKRALPAWEWKLISFLHAHGWTTLGYKWMAWRGYRETEGWDYVVGKRNGKILFTFDYSDIGLKPLYKPVFDQDQEFDKEDD